MRNLIPPLLTILGIVLQIPGMVQAQSPRVLLFVAHEDTYYSEYIVARRALEARGYTVEVRSAGTQPATTYMLPQGTDIAATAATLPGGSYAQFTQQFAQMFGASWQTEWDAIPAQIPVDGRIQEVEDMDAYDALVIAGGTGILAYRVDGSYATQGIDERQLSAADIEAAALKLNALGLEALSQGKPILAQCHGASLPAFWRIPETSGTGAEALGFSLLKQQAATGYPEAETQTSLQDLDITHRAQDKVVVASPYAGWSSAPLGASRILTSQDWYPQTVAYATQTLLNILNSYPTAQQQQATIEVLILHGGALDEGNCGAGNLANDVPCNYGGGADLPADYTHLQALLAADVNADDFQFTVSHLDITGTLPYDGDSQAAILEYLQQYDAIVFYKHWATGVTVNLQNALIDYAAQGGGVLALHHALYNHASGGLNKDLLAQSLFGVESAMNTWSGNLANYNAFSTNYGHFISTHAIDYAQPLLAPANWDSNPLPSAASTSYSYLPRLAIYDELYNNMAFTGTPTFGWGLNEITPLFSNDQNPAAQSHTTGFAKRFTLDGGEEEGRLVFFQVGERRENYVTTSAFGQVLRNAMVWLATPATTPAPTQRPGTVGAPFGCSVYPNPASGAWNLRLSHPAHVRLVDSLGRQVYVGQASAGVQQLPVAALSPGVYVLLAQSATGLSHSTRLVIQ